MINGLHSVVIWTEDPARLLPFYRDVLGLPVDMESGNEAIMAGGKLAVAGHSEVSGRARDPKRIMVDFAVDDCRAEYERLKARGVEFVREPAEDDGFIIATFLDPDGNMLQLFQELG